MKAIQAPKAVIVIGDLEFGGAQRQAVELANNMDPNVFDIHICSLLPYVPLACDFKRAHDHLHIVERRWKFDFSVVTRLARLLSMLRADVLHCFLFDATIAGRLAGRLARRPVVIDSERNTNYHIPRLHRLVYALTRRCVDLTIANSRAGAVFNSRVLCQPITRYRVIHNGVDTERFHPMDSKSVRDELGFSCKNRVVGMFASLKPQKNHPMLLRAAARIRNRVPNLRLLFVGDELHKGMNNSVEFKKEVERQVDALGLRDICRFIGNRPDVERYYNACDLTVLPSLFEGTPNAVLESMACGVPVVATDVSDNRFILPDGEVGFVVPPGDEHRLADCIVAVLNDKSLRENLSISARNWVFKEFSTTRLANKTAAVYREALGIRRAKILPGNFEKI